MQCLDLQFTKKNTKNWYTIDALGAIFVILTMLTLAMLIIVNNIDIKLEQSYFDVFSNMDTIVSQSDETNWMESTSKMPIDIQHTFCSLGPPLPASL